ncbi:MAG: esterase [Fibrobacterota bacterium]|nr:esterase [Fibrobacterota bacterium]
MTAKKLSWPLAVAVLLIVGACQINKVECDQECLDFWMDGPIKDDSCVTDSTCRVSVRIPKPDSAQKKTPVVLLVHGYTASTYEWKEYKAYLQDTAKVEGKVNTSMILLGGHGLNIDEFRESTWKEWGKPLLEEYDSLRAKGFEKISIACASTGCALLMQYLSNGEFKKPPPKWIFMIDPIVVPSAKLLSLANIVGPILGNSPNPGSDSENAHWYVNRPQETLQELYALINRVKNQLESGFKLPKDTKAKVYKSKIDRSADPVGALLIYKGLRKSDGSHIDAEMLDSRLHVVTRLDFREPAASKADTILQARIFKEMTDRILAKP